MFLFTRRVRIDAGHNREAMEWALGQTEKVKQITGLQVSLYMQVFSPEVGAIGWSTFVPDLATLEAAGDKLNADDAFLSALEKGAALTVGGADDTLSQVIHGEPDPNRQIEYVTGVRAVCATGNLARGLELGVEIAQRAEKITGTPTLFLADVTGTYGGVGWVSGHANVQAVEAAQQALAADPGWAKYLDKEVRDTYAEEPSLTTQLIYRRRA
jgi:hypothetical protein